MMRGKRIFNEIRGDRLTFKQACVFLGVHVNWLYLHSRLIEYNKVGCFRFLDKDQLVRAMVVRDILKKRSEEGVEL